MNKIARQPSIRDSASPLTSNISQATSQPKVFRHPLSTISEDPVCADPIGPSNDSQKDLEYLHKLTQFVSPVKRDRKAAQLRRTESLSRLSDQTKTKTKVSASQVLEWSANLSDTQRAAFLARADITPRVPIGHPIPRLHLSMLGKPLISGSGSFYVQGEEGYERYASSSAAKERYLKAIREETRWEGEAKLVQKNEIRERLRREEERRVLEEKEAKARQLAEEAERRKEAEREATRLHRKGQEKQEAERQHVILEENQRRKRILADREQKRKEQVEEERRERVRIETMEAQKNPFDLYDLKWAVIRGEKKDYDIPSELSFHQLPWPALFNVDKPEQLSYDDVKNFVLSDARRGVWLSKSWKERIKLEMLRWHPDRFCAKVLPFVQDCDREATLQGANRVTGYLTSIRERMEATR